MIYYGLQGEASRPEMLISVSVAGCSGRSPVNVTRTVEAVVPGATSSGRSLPLTGVWVRSSTQFQWTPSRDVSMR